MPDIRQHDLLAVRQVGKQLAVAFWGGVATSSLPPIRSVSTLEFWTRVYWFSSGLAGQESKSRPPAVRNSVPGLPITDPRSAWVAKKTPGVGGVGPREGGDVAPHLGAWEDRLGHREWSHAPLPSPLSAARSVSIVHGALSGPAPSVVACIRPQNAPSRTLPVLIGRNHQSVGNFVVGRVNRGREVWRPAAAGRVVRTECGVPLDLLARRLGVPEEVAGRVDADHHRAVDPLRIPPGVDQRRARAGALAEEVDALVTQRLAGRVEVVDALGNRVPGEVDAVVLEAFRAVLYAAASARIAFSVRRPRACSRADVTSGQSSLDEPSTPR